MYEEISYQQDHKTKKWRVIQRLESMSFYNLEGSFEDVVKYLNDKKKQYAKYKTQATEIRAHYYVDCKSGTPTWVGSSDVTLQSVKFDEIELDLGDDYDGEKVLRIIGKRNLTVLEQKAIKAFEEKQAQKAVEDEEAAYERLKKKFEKKQSLKK